MAPCYQWRSSFVFKDGSQVVIPGLLYRVHWFLKSVISVQDINCFLDRIGDIMNRV